MVNLTVFEEELKNKPAGEVIQEVYNTGYERGRQDKGKEIYDKEYLIDKVELSNGYTIKTYPSQDIDMYNPRDNDNLTTVVCSHKRYKFPNEIDLNFDDFSSWEEVEAYIRKTYKPVFIKTLNMYDHSGISIWASDNAERYPYDSYGWDSGVIGLIFVDKKGIEKMGTPKKSIEKVANEEINEFACYEAGEVYDMEVIDKDGEEVEDITGYGYNDMLKFLKEIWEKK